MDKPKYLLPFIFVYKMVIFLIALPFKVINYFFLGFFFSFYVIVSFIFTVIMYFIKGLMIFLGYAYEGLLMLIIYPSKAVYHFLRLATRGFKETFKLSFYAPKNIVIYAFVGFIYLSYLVYKILYTFINFVFYLPIELFKKYLTKYRENKSKKKEKAAQVALEKQRIIDEKKAELKKKEEEIKQKRLELIAERKRRKENDYYENKDVVIEKKSTGELINNALLKIFGVPSFIVKKIKNRIDNSSFVKNIRNRREMEKENLLSSFQGEDDERSTIKQLYQYKAKDQDGRIVTEYFDAYSRVEVHSFLLSEGYEVYSIKASKWSSILYGTNIHVKIKTKDLIFFLTQLSTYIKAGIPLVEALKILINQFTSRSYKRLFRSLIYDLTMGDSFSEALSKQKDAFPRILINMVKAAEMTGQLPEVLDDMALYFTQIDKTKRQMVTIMTYPAIIFVIAIAVVSFIMIYVIPRFVQIYETMDKANIPGFTLFIIGISKFLQTNGLWVLLGFIIFIFIFIFMYKEVKLFKALMQWIIMHVPGFGRIVIYNEVTMFSKTFSSLLAHNVFITDSMDILNKITENEIYKMLILDTINNLAKGEKISESFKRHWAFPLPAYEMIVTGEKTGELPEMMAKVADYYQELHSNSITRLKTLIEPLLIVFLTFIVGGIVLAIVIPMFNMYQSVQG